MSVAFGKVSVVVELRRLHGARGTSHAAEPTRSMRGLCQRAWLLLVLLVGLLTWHIRPQHGRVVVDTHPSRDHTIPAGVGSSPGAAGSPGAAATHAHSLPQQQGRASEPRAAAEEVPEWAADHEPRTRSLLRLFPHLLERHVHGASEPSGPRRAVPVVVPGIDALGGCPGNCSGHGQCQSQRGSTGAWTTRCACAPGWNGTACEVRDASPCNTPHGGRVLSRYRVRVSRYMVRVRAAC